MNAPATAAAPTAEKTKGAAPVIKGITMTETGWKDTVALWTTKEDATAKLKGFIMDGDVKINVLGFINENKEKGTKFISLSKSVDGKLERVATGNAINAHKDGSQAYFDTVAFNVGEKSIFGRLTNAATEELSAELGFTSAPVPRPAKADEAASEVVDETVAEQPARQRFRA